MSQYWEMEFESFRRLPMYKIIAMGKLASEREKAAKLQIKAAKRR